MSHQNETKTCQNCKNDFTIESEDFEFYEKIKVPAPTFCPQCRLQRRLAWRNYRFLYRRKSDLSGKDIFSSYDADAAFPVYETSEWWSDGWDAMQYGQDYDFEVNFFEQFQILSNKVPRPARSIVRLENSDYSNNAADLKDCYLVFNASRSEDVVYGINSHGSRSCVDCSYVNDSELCYDSSFLNRCTKTHYSVGCNDCLEVYFSKDCYGCTDCFGCVNLRNKKYYIFNEPYSEEDYREKIASFEMEKYENVQVLKEHAQSFWLQHPVRYTDSLKSNNFTGTYIYNSQDVYDSYFIQGGRNLKHCQFLSVPTSEDCYDHSFWGANSSLVYESCACGDGVSNVHFSSHCYVNISDIEYSIHCHSSSDLFGCVGLRNKQYCIFNKQYSKEEYFELRDKIIQHMKDMPYQSSDGTVYSYGEFFPTEFSPTSYNKALANEFFPLTEAEAHTQGLPWKKEKEASHQPTLSFEDIPAIITKVDDSLLQEILACEETGKPFRIVKSELDLYRKLKVPVPHLHPEVRYEKRRAFQLPAKLYKRTTADGKEVMTAYSPNRPEIILSEEGYQNEVM